MWVRKSDNAGSGFVKIGAKKEGRANGGSGVDSVGAAKDVDSVDAGKIVRR